MCGAGVRGADERQKRGVAVAKQQTEAWETVLKLIHFRARCGQATVNLCFVSFLLKSGI